MLVVQYEETDWEFIRRLASHFHTILISDYLTPGVKFYFGLPPRQASEAADDCEYRLVRSLISYEAKMQNGVTGISEYDDLSLEINSRELWEIGDRVLFEGRPYVIAASQSKTNGHQLLNTYRLITENGLKAPKRYNEKMIGASIDGIVTGVKNSVVSVRLGIEDPQPSTRWFDYATVFSSPDGSGWYCMPQAGDEIRLYFPTRSEKHAYAVSSVHKTVEQGGNGGGGEEAPRTNPTANELRSPDGKVVTLRDNAIILTNGKGLTISMVDAIGINIESSGAVNLNAKGAVSIAASKDITLAGKKSVTIKNGGASLTLKDGSATLSGKDVKVQ